MNIENAKIVLEHLKTLPNKKVYMGAFFVKPATEDPNDLEGTDDPLEFAELLEKNVCGTAACLAGWTIHLLATPEQKRSRHTRINPDLLAQELLGLEDSYLFLASGPYGKDSLNEITREDVIRVFGQHIADAEARIQPE